MRLPITPPASRKDSTSTLHDFVYKNAAGDVKECVNESKADVNVIDDKKRTPLYYAACFGRSEITQTLLNAGCDLNICDGDGNAPLHTAVDNANLEIVHILVKQNGCNLDAKNNSGQTPLMMAAYYDYADILKSLLKAGAKCDVKDASGQTALLIALNEGSHVSAEMLIRHGCDVSVTDACGHSALYIAVHSTNIKSLDLAKKIVGAGYNVKSDSKWLLSEDKHNLFFQDDAFYEQIIRNTETDSDDSENGNDSLCSEPKDMHKTYVRTMSIKFESPESKRRHVSVIHTPPPVSRTALRRTVSTM